MDGPLQDRQCPAVTPAFFWCVLPSASARITARPRARMLQKGERSLDLSVQKETHLLELRDDRSPLSARLALTPSQAPIRLSLAFLPGSNAIRCHNSNYQEIRRH